MVALALIGSVLPTGSASAQAPTQRTLLNASFKGVTTPGATFDLVQSVTDFAPGAASQVITTATPHYLSVVAGELTVDIDGKSDVVPAGKGVAVPAQAKARLSNASTTENARLFASTLLSVGAVRDVHQLSAPGIKVFAVARRTMANAPAEVDIVQIAAAYPPGYRTPNHVMNEFHLMIHLSGKIGYAYLDGGVESYAAGSQAVMYEGRPGLMRNDAQSESSIAWTFVANPGKPLTSAVAAAPAPAPGAPNTGTGMAHDGATIPTTAAAGVLLLVIVSAFAFVAKRNSGASGH
jgi:quercetin dioxygenase-like cupin family protein